MKVLVGLAFAGAIAVSSGIARADASESCFAAAVEGQKLRNAGRLLTARGELGKCASVACPEEVTKDCSRWLGEVGAALPTLVLGARDAAGRDLLDVRVLVDDAPSGTTEGGRPVAVDPGPHKLRFVRSDGTAMEQTVVARSGEKNRSIVVKFAVSVTERALEPAPPSALARVPTATWVLGGVGIAALGAFGYFAATGLGDYRRLGCDVGCAAIDKKGVDAQFLMADVSLVVGVLALGAATVFYLTRSPSGADHFVWRARRIWK